MHPPPSQPGSLPDRVRAEQAPEAALGVSPNVHRRYHAMVQRIARKTVRGVAPRAIGLDDAVSAGWLGLLDALGRRKADMSEQCFEAFACYRVKGAILDQLRVFDPLSRGQRRLSRQINRIMPSLTASLGRAPESAEIAKALGMKPTVYQRMTGQLEARLALDWEPVEPNDLLCPDSAPDVAVDRRKLIDAVEKAIKQLPQRLAVVLALYYQEDLSLREIAQVLGVTDSRVCQLHKDAVRQIQKSLRLQAQLGS